MYIKFGETFSVEKKELGNDMRELSILPKNMTFKLIIKVVIIQLAGNVPTYIRHFGDTRYRPTSYIYIYIYDVTGSTILLIIVLLSSNWKFH